MRATRAQQGASAVARSAKRPRRSNRATASQLVHDGNWWPFIDFLLLDSKSKVTSRPSASATPDWNYKVNCLKLLSSLNLLFLFVVVFVRLVCVCVCVSVCFQVAKPNNIHTSGFAT